MKDIVKKEKEDLKKLLVEKKEALLQFRFNTAGGKLKNVREGRNIKREIAQIFTVIASKTDKKNK